MAQAVRSNSTPVPAVGMGSFPLSSLFHDPAVRQAFQRAERDDGAAFAVPSPSPRPLLGPGRLTRPEIEEAIEDLIGLLDATDGDADLELTAEDDEDGCDCEAMSDDNGIADELGLWQQGFDGYAERFHLAQAGALLGRQEMADA